MQLLGIVGWKNSGKTTLVARLIPALRERGLSVSTIKHVHHSIDLDQPGKDTFAHREAGAVDVALFSGARWAVMHERRERTSSPPDLDDLMRHMTEVDLVLVEGFKYLSMPRIEIRGDEAASPVGESGVRDVLAVVTDGPADAELPTFKRDEIERLADFIKQTVAASIPTAAQA